MGLFDKVSSAVSTVGESVSSGVAGAEDVFVGAATGDQDRVEQGLSDVGTSTLDVVTVGHGEDVLNALADLGDSFGGLFGGSEDKSKETAEDLREKQQELADVQRDEAIRLQQEQAAVAKRNIFRQRVAQDVQTQAAQASAAARGSIQGGVTSVAAQTLGSLEQQAAGTAFGAQFGTSEVERQLAANLGFIETTSALGVDISNLSQTLAQQQQAAQQQAGGFAGILQGAIGGAGAGAAFGPWGAAIGGVAGGLAGGASSGAFNF